MTEPSLHARCAALVQELGLASAQDVRSVQPLAGGVASDIAKVSLPGRENCVKFALAKLKVAEDWQAPVHRNAAEYAWLQVAAKVAPNAAVQLFGQSQRDHGFAMEFLDGRQVYLWKAAMLAGDSLGDEAAMVGDLLGRIHAASWAPGFDTSPFHNADDFFALRIEPYLLFTATKHPKLAARLTWLADQLARCQDTLVHGDVSPKNILMRDGAPVILDAECASMGDASFDLAFCLNHLVLKAVYLPGSRGELLANCLAFWRAYAAQAHKAGGLILDDLEARTCGLLPALMLACVDGKSPVEYLSAGEQDQVRSLAIPLIEKPVARLEALISSLAKGLEGANS